MRAALLIALCAFPAGAWETHLASDGTPRRWSFAGGPLNLVLVDPPAGLRLKPGGDLRLALVRAAEAWQAVESAHVPVRYQGQVHPRLPGPGEVTVQFDTGAEFPGGHDAAGITSLSLSGHDLTAARIHLNAADFDWATDGSDKALDVQSIVEHELGHALGLAHPCGDLDTQTPSCTALPPTVRQALDADVMAPSITPGPRRALSPDDLAGLTALQPSTQPEVAPELKALVPACLPESQQVGPGLSRNLTLSVGRAPEPVALELFSGDTLLAQSGLGRDGSGVLVAILPPAALRSTGALDARLSLRSGKATVLFDALEVRTACDTRGCSSGDPTLLALFPLVLFARRRGQNTPRRRQGSKGTQRMRLFATSQIKNDFASLRRSSRLRGVPLLFLILLLSAGPALAYKQSVNGGGVKIWWSTRGHPFQIDALGTPDVPGPAAFTAIRRSFLSWASVSCSDLAFPDQGLSQNPKDRVVGYFPGAYNRNLVLFRTRRCGNGKDGGVVPAGDPCLGVRPGCGNTYDCWDDLTHGSGVIATTTTTSNKFTGQINDTDIEINDSIDRFGTKFTFTAVDGSPCTDPNQTGCVRLDVQNTITHEAGHSLGLDHTLDPNATMYATAPEGEVSKRVLGADDIQGICDIYPRGKQTVTGNLDPITLTPSGASNGGGCGSTQPGPAAALAALLLLLQKRRRSRRKPQLAMSSSKNAATESLRGNSQLS